MSLFNSNYREEYDTLGKILVPANVYYGSQTQRAIENFQISGICLPFTFIKAQAIIKAAAASVHMELGKLPIDIGSAIISAAEEVTAGQWNDQFVVDVYQAGAGTSQNMNMNEVIANRASELLGQLSGTNRVHPNDHVNMSQSTNDTFHAAINMSAAEELTKRLLPAIQQLKQAFENKAEEFMPILKSGRTHLHDAVPIRLGQEFSGYAGTMQKVYKEIEGKLDQLYEIGLGGSAIGTKINAEKNYPTKVIQEIRHRTSLPFRQPTNLFTFMQNTNAAISLMIALKELAVHLIKITSDLRLLSSGPRTGLAEITLPPVQPGSTIMPGKVNPAILEMTHMVSCQIIGYEAAIGTAGIAGQLEINVMMPVIAYTLLHSIELLSNALPTLVTKCINGIQADEKMCKHWMESSLSLVTALSPKLGYDQASQIGIQADEENKSIKQVLKEKDMLTPEFENLLDPKGMI